MKAYSNVDESTAVLVDSLTSELAFLMATLNELKATVNKEGATMERINGNGFSVIEEHPAQKSYNATIKSYNATIKALSGIAPVAEKSSSDSDDFMTFLTGRAEV